MLLAANSIRKVPMRKVLALTPSDITTAAADGWMERYRYLQLWRLLLCRSWGWAGGVSLGHSLASSISLAECQRVVAMLHVAMAVHVRAF